MRDYEKDAIIRKIDYWKDKLREEEYKYRNAYAEYEYAKYNYFEDCKDEIDRLKEVADEYKSNIYYAERQISNLENQLY